MLGGSLLITFASIIEMILNMVQITIIASIVISWVGAPPSNQIVAMIHAITEPMYRPLRKYTSKIPGPFDWAPMVILIIVIQIMMTFVPWIKSLGYAAK